VSMSSALLSVLLVCNRRILLREIHQHVMFIFIGLHVRHSDGYQTVCPTLKKKKTWPPIMPNCLMSICQFLTLFSSRNYSLKYLLMHFHVSRSTYVLCCKIFNSPSFLVELDSNSTIQLAPRSSSC
jgi:hypothetical protein